jgi:hypothetical protein
VGKLAYASWSVISATGQRVKAAAGTYGIEYAVAADKAAAGDSG